MLSHLLVSIYFYVNSLTRKLEFLFDYKTVIGKGEKQWETDW